jgi:hypothetical protein
MWTAVDSEPRRLYYRRSTDDGLTWLPPESLPMPPAFHPGSDTLVSVGANDLYPWYDPEGEDDDLSVAAAFYPVLQGQGLVVPVELWHWRQGSGWSRIARAECDTAHLAGGIGDAALYASRPTLGRCAATHQLVCVWEQFDSTNVEPRTGLLRADVWAARGDSAGTNWGIPVRLTDPDSTSKRFPCVAGWTMDDTFVVTYEVDRCAGFADMGQGPATENPIAAQYVSIESLPPPDAGVAEQPSTTEPTHGFGATVVRTLLCLPLGVVAVHGQSPCLLDIAGRKVLDLQPGANDVRALAPGVYFVASAFGGGHGASGVSKVVLTR